MLKWLFLLLYLLMIAGVIFAERKSPTEAVLWVLILLFLPYIGGVLYLVFGSTVGIKATAYMRKKRLKACNPDFTLSNPEAVSALLSEEDSQVLHFNTTYNQSEPVCYQSAQVFTGGESHYRQLFADIQNAKQCIYVEFYTIHHDAVGERFAAALAEKAKQGVKVLVLFDFIANLSTPTKMFRDLLDAGGEVIRVKPYLTHFRSHRKIVVIDHEISYIGGMNIGKQYANLAKVKTPWRDTQVRMTGDCAAVLDEYFLTDWLCCIRRRDWERTLDYIRSLPKRILKQNENVCQFIVGGVDTDKEAVKMCYLSMIRSAKKSILIQSPYFIPDASILDALKTAAASGVQIVLMIPGIKASFFLDPVTTYYSGQLLQYGAKIYKYNGYIHAKTMVIDEELCCIGSVNMDMRSLLVDDEICGVFYENGFAKRYAEIFEADIANCSAYTGEMFENRRYREKFSENIFLLFAPLM